METHSKHFFKAEIQQSRDAQSDLILVCDNFSTPENIGSIIRLAANIDISQVIVIGSKECRQSKVKKTAGAALGHVHVQYCNEDSFISYIPSNYTLVALETVKGAKNIFQSILPQKMVLVLGNEKYGVSEEVMKQCGDSVYIPMHGPIKSMNVSHAASVCLFEWLRQNMNV